MSIRMIASLVLALVFGIVAVLLVRGYVAGAQKSNTSSKGDVPVVVAALPIAHGATVQAPMLKVVLYPKDILPAGSFQTVDQVVSGGHVILRPLAANEPVQFRAGQFIDVLRPDGTRRSYSIATMPEAAGVRQLELHIRHMPGGVFTDHVFGVMKERDIQRIEGPQGSFFLREDSNKPLVFLASGTGFAPIKAILEHMHFKGINRPSVLYWGGRRPQDLYLNDWLQAQLALMPNLRYVPVISDALPEDNWSGRTGFVHQAVSEDIPDLSGYQVYACGAPIVVDSARSAYTKVGLPEDEFYADSFTSAADKA